jgi:hypothetical protein
VCQEIHAQWANDEALMPNDQGSPNAQMTKKPLSISSSFGFCHSFVIRTFVISFTPLSLKAASVFRAIWQSRFYYRRFAPSSSATQKTGRLF